jgi:hypothetical protein
MVLRLGCRQADTVPADLQQQLRRWLEPCALRLELVPLPAEGVDLHGLLEWPADSGGLARLCLANASLRQRLAALPAAQGWQPLLEPLEVT